MKNFKFFFFFVLIIALAGCSKIKKTEAEFERENWMASFNDSITFYQDQVKEVEKKLENIHGKIGNELEEFEKVNNPREVEGYYLLKGWKSKIPLSSTGIYARINEKEQLELIATLKGSTFNQIEAGDFKSNVVPHDQAFNYRHTAYNTVYFCSGKADTVARYIADHSGKVELYYLEGTKRKSFLLPEDEKNMIKKTYDLYSLQKEARDLQKSLWISSRKIEAFRRILDTGSNLEVETP